MKFMRYSQVLLPPAPLEVPWNVYCPTGKAPALTVTLPEPLPLKFVVPFGVVMDPPLPFCTCRRTRKVTVGSMIVGFGAVPPEASSTLTVQVEVGGGGVSGTTAFAPVQLAEAPLDEVIEAEKFLVPADDHDICRDKAVNETACPSMEAAVSEPPWCWRL